MSQTEVAPPRPAAPGVDSGVTVLDARPDEVLDREDRRRTPRIPGVRVRFGPSPAPFGHAPALDGLRALAVVAVLLYHAHFGFAVGGFLGVSVFFTLSGFLITSLLLRERHEDGSISLRRFWSRRFRRLLPASLATQALILAMAAAGVWDGDQLRALRTDVPAALGQIVNYSYIIRGTSYVGTTTAPSPLNHYWSLSLEEQFYLLFPLLVALALLLGRARRRVLVAVLVVATGVSAIACWRLSIGNVDRAYFGLDTRGAELMIGALGACAMLYQVKIRSLYVRVASGALGVVGLVVLGWLAHEATVTSQWLYKGGLLITAVASVSVIVAALQPGPVSWLLGCRPLVAIGRVSYGLYLYHWPVFIWLTPQRTGLGLWPLFGVRIAITGALAAVSYRFLERPIRNRTFLTGWRPLAVAPAAVLAVVAGLLWTTASMPARDVSLDSVPVASAGPHTGGGAAVAKPPQRVLIVGDELAASLLPDSTAAHAAHLDANVVAQPGCGVAVGGTRIVAGQPPDAVNPAACADLPGRWSASVAQLLPDVVVVAAGAWDVTDRQFWSEDPVRHPGDQTFDDFLGGEMTNRTEELSKNGATVVWLTMPHMQSASAAGVAANDPARIDHYNQLLRTVVSSTAHMQVVDLAAWAAAEPGGELATTLRPDGVTFSTAAASDAIRWLGRQVARFHRIADPAPAAAAAMTDPGTDASMPPAPVLPPRVVPGPSEPARIQIVGDSVAFGLGFGLDDWAKANGQATIDNKGQFNCPLARGGSYRFEQAVAEFPDRCDWSKEWGGWLGESRPHEVVLSTGIWDVVDRILPNEHRWGHLGDPVADRYFLRETLAAIDLLSSQGARVVLLTHHHIDVGANKGFTGLPESDPARIDRLNQLLNRAHELRPAVTSVVNVAGWVESQPGGALDPAKLKDGLHYTDGYLRVVARWLGPQLLAQLKP